MEMDELTLICKEAFGIFDIDAGQEDSLLDF